jgi:hypothetical protein
MIDEERCQINHSFLLHSFLLHSFLLHSFLLHYPSVTMRPTDARVRRERGMTQPIFMMDFHVEEDCVKFDVLGTSKVVYEVVYPSHGKVKCSCPDHVIHCNTCKHIFFITEKLLRVPTDQDWTATRDRIAKRLSHLGNGNGGEADVLADRRDVERYQEILAADAQAPAHRNPECGICLTDFADEKGLLHVCGTCLNAVHEVCWRKWCGAKAARKCAYCRGDTSAGGDHATGHGRWGVQL